MLDSQLQKPQIGRCTDVGRVRQANEDSLGDISVPNGHTLIVADGMGGYRGGALASRLVVESIEEYFKEASLSQPRKTLRQAIFLANERVYLRGRQDKELSRMGSTCVVALVQGRNVYTAHVGDSRIYLYRKQEGVLHQITRDHTVVQHFVDVGLLSPEDAEDHPESHILSRALGPRPHVEAELNDELIMLEDGDRLLLCSDGLTKMLNHAQIEELIGQDKSAQEIATHYIDLANQLGGEDNITAIVYEYHPTEAEDETTPPMPMNPINPELFEESSSTLEFSTGDVVRMINREKEILQVSSAEDESPASPAEKTTEKENAPKTEKISVPKPKNDSSS